MHANQYHIPHSLGLGTVKMHSVDKDRDTQGCWHRERGRKLSRRGVMRERQRDRQTKT